MNVDIVGVLGTLIIFGAIVAIHEFGHFVVAKLSRMGVYEFSLGFGPALFKRERNGTLYAVRAVPLGGYVRIAGMEPGEEQTEDGFYSKPFFPKFATILAGATMNFVLALFVLIGIGLTVGYPTKSADPVVVAVSGNTPAAKAGLQKGDRIVRIDDRRIASADDAITYIRSTDGKHPVAITVRRGGQYQTVPVTPVVMRQKVLPEHGVRITEEQIPLIGVSFASPGLERQGVVASVVQGVTGLGDQFRLAIANVLFIVSGQARVGDISGPVGIMRASYDMSKDALLSQAGMFRALSWLAMLSVLIGFFNLLPLPALDGGRLFSLVIEEGYQKIAGKPFDRNKEAMVHMVGMVLLLGFVLVISAKDIWQWIAQAVAGGK